GQGNDIRKQRELRGFDREPESLQCFRICWPDMLNHLYLRRRNPLQACKRNLPLTYSTKKNGEIAILWSGQHDPFTQLRVKNALTNLYITKDGGHKSPHGYQRSFC